MGVDPDDAHIAVAPVQIVKGSLRHDAVSANGDNLVRLGRLDHLCRPADAFGHFLPGADTVLHRPLFSIGRCDFDPQ